MIKMKLESIDVKDDITLITVFDIADCDINTIFREIAKLNIIVDMIMVSENLMFTVKDSDLRNTAVAVLNAIGDKFYSISSSNSKIRMHCSDVSQTTKIAELVFKGLYGANIHPKLTDIALGEVSVLVDRLNIDRAVNAIKKEMSKIDG